MRTAMPFRMNLHRVDCLRQAEELAQFTQSTETDVRVKHFGRDVVNVVESTKDVKKVEPVNKRLGDQGQKRYYLCGNTGHHKSSSPRRSKKKQDADLVLAVRDANKDRTQGTTNWVLECGLGHHLVNDLSLLDDVVDYKYECSPAASDGEPFRITKQGSTMIRVKALGFIKTIRLLDVQ